MIEQSLYDQIHDRFLPSTGSKSGTRYERLAAVVFAGLKTVGSVVHDLKLRGKVSGELHQIDVTVEASGHNRRILVECKDFDLSGKSVGISTVRDFNGVIADLRPDEAWIVSCNDFTRPARAYARGFGIKLAVLREFRESDWEGRIRTIVARIEVRSAYKMSVVRLDSSDEKGLQAVLASAYELTSSTKAGVLSNDATLINVEQINQAPRTLREFLDEDTRKQLPTLGLNPGVHTFSVLYDDVTFECRGTRAPVSAITIRYSISSVSQDVQVSAPGIAILLLKAPEGDVVVWDRDLRAYTLDEEGRVVSTRDVSML